MSVPSPTCGAEWAKGALSDFSGRMGQGSAHMSAPSSIFRSEWALHRRFFGPNGPKKCLSMAWVTAADVLRSRTLRKYPDKLRGGSIKAIAASDAIRPSVDLFLQSRGGPLHNTCSSSGALHNETKNNVMNT